MINNNINEFNNWGATCVRGALKKEDIELVENAINQNINNPSPMFDCFESHSGKPLFFNDFNNWRRLKKIKEVCFLPKLVSIAKGLMKCRSVHLFHDHLIVKRKGSCASTPWHIDNTYFMVDGEYTVSIWIPTRDISKGESLTFAKGSHLDKKLYASKSFTSEKNLEETNDFIDFNKSNIENKFEMINWDMQVGDILAFTYYTLHSAPNEKLDRDRLTLSIRYFGENTFFDGRVKNPAPPFTQIGYKGNHGDPIKTRWFPEINCD